MIDTHAHLDACHEPPGILLERARSAGVSRVITIGTDVTSSTTAVRLAHEHDGVFAAVGIHPHEAAGGYEDRLEELRDLGRRDRVVALGETGLDYFGDRAPRCEQRSLFEAHLDLATELDLPVVIHCRAAAADTEAALRRFGGTVVLHCFSEIDLLDAALDRGYFVSFAGNVTYPRADSLRAAAARVSPDLLLAETDAPYLAPQAVRGQPGEPAFVIHTLAVLAAVRGCDPQELELQIDANADRAFALA